MKVNVNRSRASPVSLQRVRLRTDYQWERVVKGGHTQTWEVICLQEIANLSGLPGDKVPLREPCSV